MQKLAIHKFCPGSINYDFIPADYVAVSATVFEILPLEAGKSLILLTPPVFNAP